MTLTPSSFSSMANFGCPVDLRFSRNPPAPCSLLFTSAIFANLQFSRGATNDYTLVTYDITTKQHVKVARCHHTLE